MKADAAKYFLGYIWWVLEPLLYVAVFYVVFNIILNSQRADFLVFLMCGKLPFVWFSKSITSASNAIVANAGLIGRIDIPKTLFPMGRVQESLYRQMAVFILLFAVLLVSGYPATWLWLWVLPIAFLQYIMIVACSFIGATIVCYMRDFSMIISLGMVFLMFTSGIFWDPRDLDNPEMTQLILTWNPLAFVLDAYRQVLMYQQQPDFTGLFRNLLIFLALLFSIVAIMRASSKHLAVRALTA